MKNNLLCMAAFLWLLILPFVVFSQKRGPDLIDSLEKAIARYGEDSNKALTLLRLGNAFAVVDLNKAFPPVNEGLQLSEKLHYTKGIANAENNLGLYMSDTGNPAGARPHFERSYTLNVQLDSKLNIVNNLVNIGRTWSYESNFPKAIDYFFKGLTVAEAIKSEQKMAFVGNNLASNFIKQQNWPKAFEYGQYTVDHAAKVGDISSLGKGYVFMGNSKGSMGDTAAAIRWTDSAIAVDKRANLLVDLTAAQGDRALFESDPARRIQMELDDETLITKVSPNSDIAFMVKELIGYDYFVLAKQATTAEKARLLKNADDYLTKAKAMAEARNNPARLAEVLQRAAELEEYEGQYKTALADRKRITAINDSLFSQENKNKIAGLETKHAVALKDAELALGELKLTNERRTTIGLIVGLGVMGLLGVLLYRQSRSRQKANAALREANLELEEANRVKARFFGILSHDLRGPVANLLHFLEIQKEAPDFLNEEQQVVHRREISASAENLLNTMEGMLLWSKQQMQSFKPVPKNTRVDELFDYVGKYVGEPEKVKLVFQPVDGLTVFTDENYLRVIMQNLTSNAIKVLKDRPDASIEWKAKKDGNNMVLSIADNGPGLTPEYAKALYEDKVTENARDGFGLHIIRDLAKAIHCRVHVQSEPGKGTEFALILPAVA